MLLLRLLGQVLDRLLRVGRDKQRGLPEKLEIVGAGGVGFPVLAHYVQVGEIDQLDRLAG